ncbi:hypothetical protein F5I97DRAFT_1831789 [Phlebopus sp. FC_14]|nr:hypothetical protein F5I97DRAFT_1831789 [Phlebopus sp. FC_14]
MLIRLIIRAHNHLIPNPTDFFSHVQVTPSICKDLILSSNTLTVADEKQAPFQGFTSTTYQCLVDKGRHITMTRLVQNNKVEKRGSTYSRKEWKRKYAIGRHKAQAVSGWHWDTKDQRTQHQSIRVVFVLKTVDAHVQLKLDRRDLGREGRTAAVRRELYMGSPTMGPCREAQDSGLGQRQTEPRVFELGISRPVKRALNVAVMTQVLHITAMDNSTILHAHPKDGACPDSMVLGFSNQNPRSIDHIQSGLVTGFKEKRFSPVCIASLYLQHIHWPALPPKGFKGNQISQ